MTAAQAHEAAMLERELRDMAAREKAQYKRQTLSQASRLLRDLLNEDEPYTEPTDEL